MGSIFGEIFRIVTFGESHGASVGCIIDGCPAGLALNCADFAADMKRRRPGYGSFVSKRQEVDEVEIFSGVFNGVTIGTPIAVFVRNKGQNSIEYDGMAEVFRPGHADFTYFAKYGIRDYRGGGRASGRETAARVIGGVVAKKILAELNVEIKAQVASIGGVAINDGDFEANPEAVAILEECLQNGDSIGSAVICHINGVKAGAGAPVFDKLSADLAKAIFSIGGVKGLEFGAGFEIAAIKGSEANDEFVSENGVITKKSNNAGGILGGISDGDKICFRAAFKPPSSIALPQTTLDVNGRETEIVIKGRHDPVIGPRACVVVEAMAAIVLVNHIFRSFPDNMESVKRAYKS